MIYLLQGISFELRQAAGLLLKNNLQLVFNDMPLSSQKYVKYELLTCIGSRHKQIRSTACTVISVLLQIVVFDKWVDLFETLRLCFDSQDLNQKEGAAETIYKVMHYSCYLVLSMDYKTRTSCICIVNMQESCVFF